MTLPLTLYTAYLAAAANGATVWAASTDLTLTLHTSAYTPDADVHADVADLSNELGTSGGYTVGGVVLSNPTVTVVAADAWTAAWVSGAAYTVGQLVRPAVANGYLYRCIWAGTSGGSAPVWPTTVGASVADGGAVWTCAGTSAVVLDADNLAPAWAAFTAGPFRHLVLSDRAAAAAADQPLIGFWSWGSDQTGGGGDFDIVFDVSGGVITIPVP